ncbi:glycosyltransferase [Bacillus sp. FJAT-42376]|uniref:glycosyltransferase n=1 Tax=Bacillus sp. FJAT-42376 TaxID=2014076 RepID=UPI000F4FD6EE|nr:glycosyltransferase [Bacillus sp. FJAT-42376]AZB43588.1 glycosyltransferase [Bacillus sp. FJAT-42376]
MKKSILISSFDLAIGGVERSLIGLLDSIDYTKYSVDLLLFKHEGEFMPFLPKGPELLPEIPAYTTFRKSMANVLTSKHYRIFLGRLLARCSSAVYGKLKKIEEPGYLTIQYGWDYTSPILPELKKEYDAAIGFLWPHHFVGTKVKAKKKIGWIHTDYSNIKVNKRSDLRIWEKLDHIVAVSEDCSKTFVKEFPLLEYKTSVIENVLSPSFVKAQAKLFKPAEIKADKRKTILVSVGRLTPAKGFDEAVKACKRLVDEGYNIEWYIVGYGPLEAKLKMLIADLKLEDRFFLLGKKVNPYPYINACDIYVQPSRYEGKAVTVKEAQILGKPLVITNFPTAASQVKDGFDGKITSLGAEGIAEGIAYMIEDEELRIRLSNNLKAENYDNSSELDKLYKLIG